MALYLIKRIAGLVGVLLVMSFIVFCLQSLIPADPARALAGPGAPPETVAALRESLGVNQPLLVQYGQFVERLLQGDLGTSVRTRQPVASDIAKYLPASLELGFVAVVLGLALAGALALLQNVWQYSGALKLTMMAIGSVPIFLSGLLLVYFFWFRLDWLPGAGRLDVRRFSGPTGLNLLDGVLVGRPEISLDALLHLMLPALTLALPLSVAVGRSLNGALLDVLKQSYIRTGRGKGLGETAIVLRHGLRNAASAPLAMIGLQMGLVFGNLLIVERVFAWPGLGLYTVQAFAASDLPAVLGVSLVFGAFYILVNMAVEIAQSLADPRISALLVSGDPPPARKAAERKQQETVYAGIVGPLGNDEPGGHLEVVLALDKGGAGHLPLQPVVVADIGLIAELSLDLPGALQPLDLQHGKAGLSLEIGDDEATIGIGPVEHEKIGEARHHYPRKACGSPFQRALSVWRQAPGRKKVPRNSRISWTA